MSSIRKTADRYERLAAQEQDLFLQARENRTAKLQGILARRANEGLNKRKAKSSENSNKRQKYPKQNTTSSKYFYALSKNMILDTTSNSKNSHMQLLPERLKIKISPLLLSKPSNNKIAKPLDCILKNVSW
ncbi:hypothetical protein BDC45DRAFT_80659 [Circinella umbellata]|nr:hypothetical protein BDC45DRAFT_80659 [Circinella umbellata]